MEIKELEEKAKQVRIDVIKMLHEAQSGHPGGSLSETDILVALYYNFLNIKPEEPDWPERDRFILSKGHACPAQYVIMADLGYFPKDELMKLRKLGGLLQGHPDLSTPGVDMASGSLGMGISYANGVALSGKLDKKDYYVYVLLGDGELDEGQIWEAAMTSAKYKIDNLICIIDRNKIQNDNFVDKAMPLEPLADKWRAFNWEVIEVDGHNMGEIVIAIEKAKKTKGKPTVIIADTIKGKGVSFMENSTAFHGKATNEEEYKKALQELNAEVD